MKVVISWTKNWSFTHAHTYTQSHLWRQARCLKSQNINKLYRINSSKLTGYSSKVDAYICSCPPTTKCMTQKYHFWAKNYHFQDKKLRNQIVLKQFYRMSAPQVRDRTHIFRNDFLVIFGSIINIKCRDLSTHIT